MNYPEILSRRFKGREWSMSGNELTTLVIHDSGPVITQAELDLLWPEVEAEINAELAESNKAKLILGDKSQVVVLEILLETVGKAVKQGKISTTPRMNKLIQKWDEINGI